MYLGRIVEQGIISEAVSSPGHPYLQALISAIPPSDPHKAKIRIELPLKSFDLPSAAAPPSGCVFHPRCPYATDICEREAPELALTARYSNRLISCHHKDTIPGFHD